MSDATIHARYQFTTDESIDHYGFGDELTPAQQETCRQVMLDSEMLALNDGP